VSNRRGIGALATFAATVAFVQLVSRLDIYHFVLQNTRQVLAWLACYFVVGFVHLFARWVVHGYNMVGELDGHKAAFFKHKSLTPDAEFTDALKREFAKYLKGVSYNPNLDPYRSYSVEKDGLKTTYDLSKDTVGRWIGWWPWCIFGFLDDYITRFGRIIKENLRGILDYISAKIFGNRGDFVLSPAQNAAAEEVERERAEQEREAAERRRHDPLGSGDFPSGGVRRRS